MEQKQLKKIIIAVSDIQNYEFDIHCFRKTITKSLLSADILIMYLYL